MTTNSTSTQGGIGEVDRTGQGSSSFYFKAIFSLQLEDEFGEKKIIADGRTRTADLWVKNDRSFNSTSTNDHESQINQGGVLA